ELPDGPARPVPGHPREPRDPGRGRHRLRAQGAPRRTRLEVAAHGAAGRRGRGRDPRRDRAPARRGLYPPRPAGTGGGVLRRRGPRRGGVPARFAVAWAMADPARPLLVFDGDCGFCRGWVARWRRRTGDRLDVAPFQKVASDFPDIPIERFRRAVQLIEPDGRRSQGAEAVFRSLAYAPRGGAWSWCYARVPGFAPLSEGLYRFVADRRGLFTRLTEAMWGPHVVPP